MIFMSFDASLFLMELILQEKKNNIMNKLSNEPEAEFKELEPRLKYGLFHLELHLMFQDLSRRSNKTGYWRI